jgi:hypothetical protein
MESQGTTLPYRIGIGKVVKGKQLPFLCTPVTTVPNFINGKSMGVQQNKKHSQNRYRLMDGYKYEPGT